MKRHINENKSNNAGFTLLEVLIAMVILTVVAVPLLRSFATSAQTNAKAKLQAKCTTASENIMEDIRNMPTQELLTTYSGCPVFETSSGDVHFEIEDNALMKADLPDGYKAIVDLYAGEYRYPFDSYSAGTATTSSGSKAYPNANGLNVSDFSPISVRDCAVYTMPDNYDKDAYDWYVNNKKPGESWEWQDFRRDLTRDIAVEIEDTGIDYTDDEGNVKDAIRVKLKIQYYCNSAGKMQLGKRTYVASEIYLFDNTATKRDLNGIYIFYYPRYEAANYGGAIKKDVIEVKNPHNYNTKVYVVAMNDPDDDPDEEDPMGRDAYFLNKRLKMYINEGTMVGDKAAIELRTNLLNTVTLPSGTTMRTPYSDQDSNPSYGMAFDLDYTANTTSFNDDDAIEKLSLADIDGKKLSTSETDLRIYKVTISVRDAENVEYSRMEGTKLVYR